ncbi:hypothetical protein [Burkholderia sp. 572]|uniref:hypothetical protein n=1 Tax=Burkholderia sp. 572 TaxID=3156414 RepID=UPI00339A1928
MCAETLDAPFNEAEFYEAITDVVAPYQRDQLLEIVRNPTVEVVQIDALAMSLLGESRVVGIVVPTRTSGSDPENTAPITGYVKREIIDLLCTNSARYKNERKEGLSTVKNLITIIATAASSQYSLPVGVLAGAVTLLLMAALKIGRNAYCEANKAAS